MDDPTPFQQRLANARTGKLGEGRRSMTYDEAWEAAKAAEKRGWGKAPSRSAIHNQEAEPGRMPGGDVVICLAAAYRINPVYLLTGRGPIEWEPGVYEKDSRLELLAQVRRVARWMLTAAGEDGPVAALLSEDDLPPVDERPGGKDDGRSVGTPRRDTA